METRKHRWGLYFAIEDFGKPRPKRTIHDGIDISLLKDIRPVSFESIRLFVTIHGMIADVTCQASFRNTEGEHIDGFFLFPVDPEAILYHFEASCCGKKIVAASREKGENHELSLLEELDGEGILLEETASDMFTCHLGVVPSDELVDVMFQYSIELSISPEGDVPFVFPSFVPREFQARYLDSIYGQADQQPFGMDGFSFDFYFQAIIAGNYMIRDVLSSEVLEIDYLDQSHYNAKLTLAGSYLPNRDFAFTMKYSDIESPHILVQKGGLPAAFDHVVMTNHCGLFTLFHRLNKTRPQSMKGEFIFCVDRSSGMRGHKIQVARETLLYFIKGLPMGCYFNIVSYAGTTQPLFKSSRVYNQYNVMKAIKCQLKMRADMQGTNNILGLLQYVYDQPIIAGHPKQVFLITEGSEFNKYECIEYVSQRAEFARMFPVGVGELCHRAIINGLARAGNGKAHFIKLNEKPYNTVLECLKQAMQPGLINLEMEFDTPAGVTCLTIPPSIPPIVFAEEKLQIYILIKGQPENPNDNDCTITLSGTLGKDEPYSQTVYFNLVESMVNENLPIHRLALKTEIKDLEKSIATALGADDILENEYQMIQAAIAANISSRFTPLVGIDSMTGQEIEGFPIIRVRADEMVLGRAHPTATSVYKSVSRLTLSRPGENPSAFVRGIFERQSGGQRVGVYSMADSRIHDFDDEVEDGLEMEYTFKRPPAAVADLDSDLALSEVYMGVSDRDEWDSFKDSLKHPGGFTKFQNPDGYWMLDKKVAYAFGSTITEVKKENPLRDDLVWTTILALNWLKVNFGIRKTEWKESEDWAKCWLHQQDLEGYSLDELFELAAGLKHLDGHTLFKPPPRPERQISTIDEDEDEESQVNRPPEPVTYMKQESITMIGNDIDDMAYDEYLNDEVHDIKTTAIEISATNRPLADKPTSSEDATKNHPGHLIVSPSQFQDAPSFLQKPRNVGSTNRHHHTTAERQESLRVTHSQSQNQEDVKLGRYGEVIAPPRSTVRSHRVPQPSKRSSFQSQSPSSSTGRVLPQSPRRQLSESEPIPTPRSQSFNQSDQPNKFQADRVVAATEYSHPNPPDPNRSETTQLSQFDHHEPTRDPDPRHQPSEPPSLTDQLTHHQPDQPELPMQDRTLQMNTSQPRAALRSMNYHHLEGTSHYSPLTPDNPFQPPTKTSMPVIGEKENLNSQIASVPVNSTSHLDMQSEVSVPSAPRPKVLPLQHTTSTDIQIDESPEGLNSEEKFLPNGVGSDPTNSVRGQDGRGSRYMSKVSLHSAVSTSYAPEPTQLSPQVSKKQKPKRSLSFKQRMKNIKDNLLYAADIKYCRKHNDLSRMNSLRASVRSGRSPYVNDYDETDALISTNKSGKSRRRNNQSKVTGQPRPGVTEGRSRTLTPELKSRAASSDSSIPEPVSRPTTPAAQSRPVTPAARSRPVTPAARSRSVSPEAKSRPTTPNFRSWSKAPDRSYFRPRTPAASDVDTPSVFSDMSPANVQYNQAESVPLIKPIAGRVATVYQHSPSSTLRSNPTQHTIL